MHFLIILLLLLSSHHSRAVDVVTCNETNPCGDDSFCRINNNNTIDNQVVEGTCAECNFHSHYCFESNLSDASVEDCMEACHYEDLCSIHFECEEDSFCSFDGGTYGHCEACDGVFGEECFSIGFPAAGANHCVEKCEAPIVCSGANLCEEGSFCNMEDNGIDGEEGVCVECYWHRHECFESELKAGGVSNCFQSCHAAPICIDEVETVLVVDGMAIEGLHFDGGHYESAEGPLIDIGLGNGDVDELLSSGQDEISGSVCLIERGEITFYDKVAYCKANGGVGAIIFNNEDGELLGIIGGNHDDDTAIPAVGIGMDEGNKLRNNNIGSTAFLQLTDYGETCYDDDECSNHFECSKGYFCNYDYETHGHCESCDAYEGVCYFDGLLLLGAKHCAEICGDTINFGDCKLCAKTLSGDTIGTATSQSDTCEFCPNGLDESYWDVPIPMFGDDIYCYDVENLFRSYEIAVNDRFCQIGLMYNHVCGCDGGTGYAGANTAAKRKAYVWLPRCTAIMSFIGSSIIISDVMRNKKKRSKMSNQMMVVLSTFDLFGSVAYSLTSLPMSVEDGVYGSKGNDASCTAQGFFIQLGTTAAFINVSLSIYYLLIIKFKWSEDKIKKYRICFFGFPVAIGLAFSFVGIPFYTNLILWCNNGALWWPEIPVILAIGIATVAMGMVCFDVYQTEQSSKRWRQAGNASNNSMSRAVFWQSFWYLMVFYFTWPPYLALQYLWSSGKAYSMYGLVLFAGTVVPLQGFWNCVAFKRGPIAKVIESTKTALTSRLSTSLVGLTSRSKTVSNSVTSNVNSSNVAFNHAVAVEAANEQGSLPNTDKTKVENDPTSE